MTGPFQATSQPQFPSTVGQTLDRVDKGWRGFFGSAAAFPSEKMDERLEEHGWTRKQMLAHISAWHDRTTERLVKLINTGETTQLAETSDSINARVARQAIGRTAGEILREMEASFTRLRRQIARLSDSQLTVDDAWAAQIIAGNTYDHYDEHMADVYLPSPPPGGAAGRR